MSTRKTKPDKRREQVRRTINRLLAAVDHSVLAADEARKARDELMRLAQYGEASSCNP